MVRGNFVGDDISIFLSEDEIINLGRLNLNWDAPNEKKLSRESLNVLLETNEGPTIAARIQICDFEDLGDGIIVKRDDSGLLIEVNDRAYWRMRDNPISGTRYDGSNKIHFYRE